jgi:hypothetical protein
MRCDAANDAHPEAAIPGSRKDRQLRSPSIQWHSPCFVPGMHTKVHGGTVTHTNSSLCTTCTHSTIIRGRTLDEEIIECHASVMHGRTIPFKVTSCSAYTDSRLPSYADMVRTAWILTPHSRRRPAGFVRSLDLKPEELAEIMMEDDE